MNLNLTIKPFLFVIFSFLSYHLVAQENEEGTAAGKDFWLTPTYNFGSSDSFLVAVSSSKPTTAYLNIPGFSYSDSMVLGYNEVKYFVVPTYIKASYYYYYIGNTNKIGNNAIHITSKLPVRVYAFSTGSYYSSGSTAVYPSVTQPPNGVYYPFKSRYNFGTTKYRYYFFSVVAITDSTLIKINNTDTNSSSFTFYSPPGDSLLLKKGQNVRLYYYSLSGAEPKLSVEATGGKQIAVYTENFYDIEDGSSFCGNYDLMYEQMHPENLLGNEFILTPCKYLKKGYKFSIGAIKDTTKIFKNGNLISTINKGEIFYGSILGDSFIQISTNKPVSCWQKYDRDTCTSTWWNNGGVNLFTINAVEQLVTDANITIPTSIEYTANYLNIVVPAIAKDSLYVDGVLIPSFGLKAILGGTFYFYTDSVPKRNIRVINSFGFYAYAYGSGYYGGYAYNASAGLKSLKPIIYSSIYKNCSDTGYLIKVWTKGLPIKNENWTFNKISKDTGFETIFYAPKAGTYPIKLWYKKALSSNADSVLSTVVVTKETIFNPILSTQAKICKKEFVVKLPYSKLFDYTWDNGSINRIKTITNSGIYSVKIKNKQTNCFFYDTIKVNFFDTIKSKIIATASSQCPGVPILLSSNSYFNKTDSIVKYQWFVDGLKTGTKMKDTVVKSFPGVYKFKLVIENLAGCKDSSFASLYFSDIPILVSGTKIIDSCAGTSNIRFNSMSRLSEGKIAGYKWLFTDLTNPSGYNKVQAIRNIKKAGLIGYRFVAYSEQGCADTTPIKYTQVYGGRVGFMSIIDSINCLPGNYFKINNTTPKKDSGYVYVWDWGNGAGSAEVDPGSVSYTDTGTYTIKLTGVNLKTGCGGDTTLRKVTVLRPPKAALIVDSFNYCLNKNYYQLTDNSNSRGATNKKTIWKFDKLKPDTFTNPNLKKVFTTAGTFNLVMYHTTGKGCVDSVKKKLIVYKSPLAKFAITDSQVCAPKASFTIKNNSVTNSVAQYNWYYPNGTKNVKDIGVLALSDTGILQIKLTIFEALYGCSDTAIKKVYVITKPKIKIAATDSVLCFVGQSLIIKDTSNLNVANLQKHWIIQTDTSKQFPLKYQSKTIGKNSIKLVYSIQNTCKDTASFGVNTLHKKDSLIVTVNKNTNCLPATFTYKANTLNPGWNIGYTHNALSIGNGNLLTHTYQTTGNKIALVTASIGNCSFNTSIPVTVLPKPKVQISPLSSISQCIVGNNFTLNASSSLATYPIAYTWLIPQNAGLTDTNVNVTFNTPGSYPSFVYIKDANQCADTQFVNLEVKINPTITLQSDSGCLETKKQVNYAILPTNFNSQNLTWLVDNSIVSTITNYTYPFANVGTQNIQAILNGTNGCVDTSNIATLTTMPNPVANFTALVKNSIANGVPVVLTNTSTNYTKSNWDLIGATSTLANLTQVYTNLGNKKIKLTVFTDFGCNNTIEKEVFVTSNEYGFIPTAFSPNNDGKNDFFKPAELSTIKQYEMFIYNRWGQKIFETTDPNKAWDGTFLGKPVPDGAYVVHIYALYLTGTGFLHNGTVLVNR